MNTKFFIINMFIEFMLCMNSQWLELSQSQTNFNGTKGIRAIEVRL